MKKQHLFFCFLILTVGAHYGQGQQTDSLFCEKYEQEAILMNGNTNKYIKNNERKRIGIFGLRLQREFTMASPESKAEYAKYCRRRKAGSALMITGGVVLLSITAVAPVVLFPIYAVTLVTGVGTYLGGALCLNNSRRNLDKAIWLRNKDVLVKK